MVRVDVVRTEPCLVGFNGNTFEVTVTLLYVSAAIYILSMAHLIGRQTEVLRVACVV